MFPCAQSRVNRFVYCRPPGAHSRSPTTLVFVSALVGFSWLDSPFGMAKDRGMYRRLILGSLVATVFIAIIPVYGLLTGHWSEMMGGRMMVWGILWIAQILAVILLGLIALAARWRRP